MSSQEIALETIRKANINFYETALRPQIKCEACNDTGTASDTQGNPVPAKCPVCHGKPERLSTDADIVIDAKNIGSFRGYRAIKYSYTPHLRARLDELFEAAKRSSNRYFVLEGAIVRAAQTSLAGAQEYMVDGVTVLVQIEMEAVCA